MAGSEWSQFHGDAGHTGWNQVEQHFGVGNAKNLKQAWPPFLTASPVRSSPVVANGLVYVGSDNGDVWALNADTGAQAFPTYNVDGPVPGSPAVDVSSDRVYVATAIVDPITSGPVDGQLVALNTALEYQWHQPVGTVYGSPTVADAIVYVGTSVATPKSGNVHAYDKHGTDLGQHITGDWVVGSPAVVGNHLYVAVNGGDVLALDKSNIGSAQIWSYHADNDPDSSGSPAVANGMAYFPFGPWVVALDTTNQQSPWRWRANHSAAGSLLSSPAVAGHPNQIVYIGIRQGSLVAHQKIELPLANLAAMKAVAGHVPPGPDTSMIGIEPSSPGIANDVANGVAFVGSTDGCLYAFKAAAPHTSLAQIPVGMPILSSPAVANKHVYIGAGDNASQGGGIFAYN